MDEKRKRKLIPATVRVSVWERYNGVEKYYGKCYTCGAQITPFAWHASHVIADVNGGDPVVENLRPCCATCNISMGSTDMREYCVRHSLPGTQYFSDEELHPFRQKVEEDKRQYLKSVTDRKTSAPIKLIKASCRWPLEKERTCARAASCDGFCKTHHNLQVKATADLDTHFELYSRYMGDANTVPSRKYQLYREWAFQTHLDPVTEEVFVLHTSRCNNSGCNRSVVSRGYCATHHLKHSFDQNLCLEYNCDAPCIEKYNYCRNHLRNFLAQSKEFVYEGHGFFITPNQEVYLLTAKNRPLLIGVFKDRQLKSTSRKIGIPTVKVKEITQQRIVVNKTHQYELQGDYYQLVTS